MGTPSRRPSRFVLGPDDGALFDWTLFDGALDALLRGAPTCAFRLARAIRHAAFPDRFFVFLRRAFARSSCEIGRRHAVNPPTQYVLRCINPPRRHRRRPRISNAPRTGTPSACRAAGSRSRRRKRPVELANDYFRQGGVARVGFTRHHDLEALQSDAPLVLQGDDGRRLRPRRRRFGAASAPHAGRARPNRTNPASARRGLMVPNPCWSGNLARPRLFAKGAPPRRPFRAHAYGLPALAQGSIRGGMRPRSQSGARKRGRHAARGRKRRNAAADPGGRRMIARPRALRRRVFLGRGPATASPENAPARSAGS